MFQLIKIISNLEMVETMARTMDAINQDARNIGGMIIALNAEIRGPKWVTLNPRRTFIGRYSNI
jgi:hypothetical protein